MISKVESRSSTNREAVVKKEKKKNFMASRAVETYILEYIERTRFMVFMLLKGTIKGNGKESEKRFSSIRI